MRKWIIAGAVSLAGAIAAVAGIIIFGSRHL